MVKLSLPHPIPITNPTSPFRNFNFMRPIKIVGSDTDLHDYQVRIHLDRSNFPLEKCKPDGSDIRFRDDSGEILPYWIERWNAAEGVIWCKIPFIPAESSKFIWMIYGNPNAKSESNGNAVFELFDVQGIVGFWHMDEPQWTSATGEVRDETGVNHGTAYGGATTTSDAKYGRAGYFDGSNDYVEVPDNDSLDVTDAIATEMWIKINEDQDASDYIFRKAGQYGLTFYGANGLRFFLVGETNGWTGFIYNSVLTTGLWHHIVQIFQGQATEINKVRLYLDGDLDRTFDFEDTLKTTINPFEIGCSIADNQLKGFVDEFRIYNRALSETEVKILSKNYMQKMGSYFNVRKYVTPAPVVIV